MAGFLDFLLKTRNSASDGKLAQAGFDHLGGESLQRGHIYPSDLFTPGVEPYILFFVRDGVAKDAPVKHRIALYMPPTINVTYGAQYQEIEMTLYQYQDIAKDVYGAVMGASNGDLEQIARKAGLNLGKALANAVDYATGANFGQQFERIVGKTVNPHMSLLFKGMDLRTFTFNFHLMARNQQESENIQKIITLFKLAMHPHTTEESGARWLNYPDNFNIGLFSPANKYLFNFNTCVLAGMNVDYAGSGIPSFFTETGAPVDIRMSLTFKELAMVTRDDIEKRNL